MAFTTRNNASSLLAGSLTAGATSLSVTPGEGAKFPSPTAGDWFPLTLAKANGSLEIVRATARSGDVITITRAQEGTAAQAFSAGDRVELRMTSAVFTELQTKTAEALTAAGTAQTSANNAQSSADTANTAIANTVVRKDSSTGAATLPGGTTAQRSASPAVGMIRYNSDLAEYERYQNGKWLPLNNVDKAFNEAPATVIASASTVDIGAVNANTINITGTASITSLGTAANGVTRRLIFQGAVTVVHNFPTIILPSTASILAVPGDVAEFLSLGGGNWQCISYQRITGYPVIREDQKQLCTAWVNFNGQGNVAQRDSYNVSSVTDLGVGQYQVNFNTAMNNANYSVVVSISSDNTVNNSTYGTKLGQLSTSAVSIAAHQTNQNSYFDPLIVCVQVFGGR